MTGVLLVVGCHLLKVKLKFNKLVEWEGKMIEMTNKIQMSGSAHVHHQLASHVAGIAAQCTRIQIFHVLHLKINIQCI